MPDRIYIELDRIDAETFANAGSVAIEPQAFAYEMAQQRVRKALRAALASQESGEGGDWPEVTLGREGPDGPLLNPTEMFTSPEHPAETRRYIPAPKGSEEP